MVPGEKAMDAYPLPPRMSNVSLAIFLAPYMKEATEIRFKAAGGRDLETRKKG